MHGQANGVNTRVQTSSAMLQEIYERLHCTPFEPFTVRTSDGNSYLVPTPGHAKLNPKRTRLVIWTDDDGQFSLSDVHTAGIGSPQIDR